MSRRPTSNPGPRWVLLGAITWACFAQAAAAAPTAAANGESGGGSTLQSMPLDCSSVEPKPGGPVDGANSVEFLGPLRFVVVGNNRFAYRRFSLGGPDTAAATPLVLVLGYAATQSVWGPSLLRQLAQHREVIIFDNVAQGQTEELVPTTGAFTAAQLTDAALDFMQALNLTRPHVAGWSLGACLVLRLAAFHPERISKAVSWAGTSPDGRAVVGSLSTLRSLFRPNNTDSDYARLNFNVSTPAGLRGACLWLRDKSRMPPDEAKPEVSARYSAGIMLAMKPWDWSSWKALARCQTPVLLMGGTGDTIIPPLAQTKLAQQIPGAWLVQFPGAGHGFLWEYMEQALGVMHAFFQEPAASVAQAGNGSGRSSGSDGRGTATAAAAEQQGDREL